MGKEGNRKEEVKGRVILRGRGVCGLGNICRLEEYVREERGRRSKSRE